ASTSGPSRGIAGNALPRGKYSNPALGPPWPRAAHPTAGKSVIPTVRVRIEHAASAEPRATHAQGPTADFGLPSGGRCHARTSTSSVSEETPKYTTSVIGMTACLKSTHEVAVSRQITRRARLDGRTGAGWVPANSPARR